MKSVRVPDRPGIADLGPGPLQHLYRILATVGEASVWAGKPEWASTIVNIVVLFPKAAGHGHSAGKQSLGSFSDPLHSMAQT
ncbi:hypothetical protein ACHFJ0_05930 [Paracoccus sp. NGMCC 1.201697]|uniref:Uncharacterized protein n=1 Tax=Paracoccus broussonetiae subsp. drimophilus TaxID=3373869 RepID=A0ABW7LIZ9_9RHOB